jgi:L-lactate dehydrogenase complex protein LldG
MSQSPSKNNILKKIRMALANPTPLPFPKSEGNEFLFQPAAQDLVVEFAEQFSSLQGKFVFCIDEEELNQQIQKLFYQNQWTKLYCTEEKWRNLIPPPLVHDDIESCEAAITSCELLVARTGSMVLASVHQGRIPSVYAPIHVCIAFTSQLVYDIKDGMEMLKNKYRGFLPSMISFATGPSRTADIEKTLVVGVHGPKEVYCFVVDDSNN